MYQRQKGATVWQWLIVGMMAGVFLYVGMMVTPKYLDNMGVKKALKNVQDVASSNLSQNEMRRKIMAQLQVEGIREIKQEQIKFKLLHGGKTEVTLDWDVKIPLFSNISVLVEFRNKVEV